MGYSCQEKNDLDLSPSGRQEHLLNFLTRELFNVEISLKKKPMENAFDNLNWLAIAISAISAFVLGGLWYSPILFAKRWMKETGITEEQTRKANMVRIFSLAFIQALIAAFFLAMFIGAGKGAGFGALAGFMAGFGWVATFMGISYLFESRTLAHFFINAGYSILSLTIMGLIVGAMQ